LVLKNKFLDGWYKFDKDGDCDLRFGKSADCDTSRQLAKVVFSFWMFSLNIVSFEGW
jgi:hypothetical protein